MLQRNRLFTPAKVGQNPEPVERGERGLRATARVMSVIALALLLAGCDKCGNWFFGLQAPAGLDACRNTTPKPQ
jgi:hypothetical protein